MNLNLLSRAGARQRAGQGLIIAMEVVVQTLKKTNLHTHESSTTVRALSHYSHGGRTSGGPPDFPDSGISDPRQGQECESE